MDNLDFHIISYIGDFLDIESKIRYYLINKYNYKHLFIFNLQKLKTDITIEKDLCIKCNTSTGQIGYLIYLCNCTGKYPRQHNYCGLLNKFNGYTRIDKCPYCNDKVMVFLKEPKYINMLP